MTIKDIKQYSLTIQKAVDAIEIPRLKEELLLVKTRLVAIYSRRYKKKFNGKRKRKARVNKPERHTWF